MNFNRTISDTGRRLGPVRFSYAHVFHPGTNSDGTPGKYSLCVIFPKTDTETYALIKSAYEAAVALGKTTKWNGRVPAKVKLPIHDGDEEHPDDEAFKNCWYLNCSSKSKPGVRVREAGMVVEALDENDFYSGCYGAVTINLYPFSTSGNVGVGVGLNNCIKTEDGERLGGGGRNADEDFADMAD